MLQLTEKKKSKNLPYGKDRQTENLYLAFFALCFLILNSSVVFGQAQGGAAAGGGGTSTPSGATNEMTVVIRDTPENLSKIEELIKSLDVPPKQVLIQAHLFDVTLDNQNSTGIDWEAIITQLGNDKPILQYKHSAALHDNEGKAFGTGILQFGTLNSEHFALLLTGLKKNDRVRNLSNPKVTTLSGQEAIISVTRGFPYFVPIVVPGTGGGSAITVNDPKVAEVPIKLTVTPTIYDDGTIRLKVYPEISKTVGVVVPGQRPATESRFATTDVIIKDSETLILGGLITEDISDGTESFPLFNKIPLVRKLFSKQVKRNIRSELAVFITPNIIQSKKFAPQAQNHSAINSQAKLPAK